jgi:quinol-cytochrome oxidoreductase complex cytochrome b subunit
MHGEYRYEPKNGFMKWLDSRLPIMRLLDESVLQFPTPKNLNYWFTFGGILTLMLAVQIVTGIVLAMHYVPHETMAFDSVEHIMRDVNYGWLLRYAHSNGASMFFIAVYIHIFRGLYYGSYKAPREVLWILGVIIYLLMMATGFLGYTLPWGQMSFWGATVITNFFSAIPLVGDAVTQWLWGSFAVDNSTLQRFFSLHYLLPFVIAGVVVLHIWALHVPGNNNPLGIDVKGPQDTLPFHPYYTMKDGFALAVFVLFFAALVFFAPNLLGNPDNFVPANRLVTPMHIVPEWYYLPFYAILRSVPSKLLGVILLFAGILVWAFLPWLDTSYVRSARFRPIFRQLFWVFGVVCIGLGWCGAQTPDHVIVDLGPNMTAINAAVDHATKAGKTPEEITAVQKSAEASERVTFAVVDLSRILTIAYFAFFFPGLFLLGWVETPLPLPESISKAVLGTRGGAASGGRPLEQRG